MTTRAELEGMKIADIAKAFGFDPPKPGTKRADIIDRALAASGEESAAEATVKPMTREADGTIHPEDVPMRKASVPPNGTFPRIEVRAVDKGISLIYTPLGGGRWRVETTADGGSGEAEGGIEATWDGTTLVLANAYQDQLSHFTWFDPAVAPVIEEAPETVDADVEEGGDG